MSYNITVENDQTYVSIPIGEEGFYKFYINYRDTLPCPDDRFVLDIFASNELYFSLPPGKKLSAAKDNLQVLLNIYILKTNSILYQSVTDVGQPHGTFLYSCESPTNPLIYAWSLLTSTFFDVVDCDPFEDSPSAVLSSAPTPHNVCSQLTYHASDLSYISETYPFANLIKDIPICTSSSIVSSGNLYATCPFFPHPAQKTCHGYSVSKNNLINHTLTLVNTNSTIHFSLDYLPTTNNVHHFQINNNTQKTVVSEFTYNYDINISYEDLVSEVTKIFYDYVNCYSPDTHVSTSTNPTNYVTKNSYINSLLGV